MDDNQKFLVLATEIKKLKSQLAETTIQVTTVEKQIGPQGPKGDKGEPGKDGLDGRDGRDGSDGQDGKDGVDGVGIESVEVTFDNSLVVRLTDGTEIDAGEIRLDPSSQNVSQPVSLIQNYSGPKIYVQATQPEGAQVGDLWYQT